MLLIRLIALLLLFSWSQTFANHSLEGCVSFQKREISHFDFLARPSGLKKRFLVIAGVHGDEPQAYELALLWISRLEKIKTPSNFWRIIPLVNPDGAKENTRYNSRKVDINRNFPTKDWERSALNSWRDSQNSDPRRYPGATPGSEIETQCVLKHIQEFRPDLVISIHTPYGQFDFDGPSHKKLKSNLLPWKQIGTFPGSLGRYLWDERRIPVLTIELRPDSLKSDASSFILLQDYLSDLI